MSNENIWARLGVAAAAGLLGTMALQAVRTANQKLISEGEAPIKADPGAFMLSKAKDALPPRVRSRVPQTAEKALTDILPLGYGMTLALAYAAARSRTKRRGLEGLLFGLAAWAVGYLGWLPATGLMPPIWKHKPRQIITPIAEHAIYGLTTVAGLHWLRARLLETGLA